METIGSQLLNINHKWDAGSYWIYKPWDISSYIKPSSHWVQPFMETPSHEQFISSSAVIPHGPTMADELSFQP